MKIILPLSFLLCLPAVTGAAKKANSRVDQATATTVDAETGQNFLRAASAPGSKSSKAKASKHSDYSWLEGKYTCVLESAIETQSGGPPYGFFSIVQDNNVNGLQLNECPSKATLEIGPQTFGVGTWTGLTFFAEFKIDLGFDFDGNYKFYGVGSYNSISKGDDEITFYDHSSSVGHAVLKLTKLSKGGGTIAADFYDDFQKKTIITNTYENTRSYLFEKADGRASSSPTASPSPTHATNDASPSVQPSSSLTAAPTPKLLLGAGALRCYDKSNLGLNSPTDDVGSTLNLKQVNQEGEDEVLVSCLSTESFITKESISTECENEMYDVAVSVVPGPHFFLLATKSPDSSSNAICPTTLAFDTLNFEKKIAAPYEEDFKALPSYELKTAVKLTDLLEAEESAESHDASNFDVLTNNCVHYASKIWRHLGVHETEDLADFIVANIINDENVLNSWEDEGVRRLVQTVMTEGRVKKIVYSQLHLNK
jgi:hypothetical protein